MTPLAAAVAAGGGVCAQVDRYKQLLLKQRDIMIALTARLNERDEQIMTLQVSWHVMVCSTLLAGVGHNLQARVGSSCMLSSCQDGTATCSEQRVPCCNPRLYLPHRPFPTPVLLPPCTAPWLTAACYCCTAPGHMQEELEAYDKHQRLLEDQLDSKTAELIGLRRAALAAATSNGQDTEVRGGGTGGGVGGRVRNAPAAACAGWTGGLAGCRVRKLSCRFLADLHLHAP
jgi:hypothetical protein